MWYSLWRFHSADVRAFIVCEFRVEFRPRWRRRPLLRVYTRVKTDAYMTHSWTRTLYYTLPATARVGEFMSAQYARN